MDVVEVMGYIEVMPYVTLISFASFACTVPFMGAYLGTHLTG
jgi:hypothetical protein